ncbi:MAG: HAD hydrolase family protein [Verrucomicrobiia bacterium]
MVNFPVWSPMALLLSTDFDGTLTDPARPDSLCPRFFGWIEEVRRHRSLIWVINTGRDWVSLQAELLRRRVPFFPDWVILVERHLHEVSPSGEPHPAEDWNAPCDRAHAELFDRTRSVFEKLRQDLTPFAGLELVRDVGCPLGLIAESEAQANAIQPLVDAAIAPHPDLACVRNSVYFRFGHAAYTKGSALDELGRRLDLPPALRIAAGDQFNDLPMLRPEVAAWLICPSNAIPEVRAQVLAGGGIVAQRPYGTGVADALHQVSQSWG